MASTVGIRQWECDLCLQDLLPTKLIDKIASCYTMKTSFVYLKFQFTIIDGSESDFELKNVKNEIWKTMNCVG